jgi:hypothetical protein
MGFFSSRSKEQAIQDSVDDLRARAKDRERAAKLADKVGARGVADKQRHDAKLDRKLAAQQEAGLKSGAYKAGCRQHPSVEEQCGCRRCKR